MTPTRKKIRISRDQQGHILEVMEKKKVADLPIHCPASLFDIRVSINTETKMAMVEEAQIADWTKQSERRKDRISYVFDRFIKVDLTQVRQQEVHITLSGRSNCGRN